MCCLLSGVKLIFEGGAGVREGGVFEFFNEITNNRFSFQIVNNNACKCFCELLQMLNYFVKL